MLKFYYGVMGSAKTAQMLIKEHDLRVAHNNTIVYSPRTGRGPAGLIESRIEGLSRQADVLVNKEFSFIHFDKYCDAVKENWFCDEVQFYTKAQIQQLRLLASKYTINCYGLITDFQNNFFEASSELLRLADKTIEIRKKCNCGNYATINARFLDGEIVKDGPQIQTGGDESYKALCFECWLDNLAGIC